MGSCRNAKEPSWRESRRWPRSVRRMAASLHLRPRYLSRPTARQGRPSGSLSPRSLPRLLPSQPRSVSTRRGRRAKGWTIRCHPRKEGSSRPSIERTNTSSLRRSRNGNPHARHLPTIHQNLRIAQRIWPSHHITMQCSSLMRSQKPAIR